MEERNLCDLLKMGREEGEATSSSLLDLRMRWSNGWEESRDGWRLAVSLTALLAGVVCGSSGNICLS